MSVLSASQQAQQAAYVGECARASRMKRLVSDLARAFAEAPRETTVYRAYDARSLLYVGQTIHTPRRMRQHAARARWWPHARRFVYTTYPDRPSALLAEFVAIAVERPRYNFDYSEFFADMQGWRGE